MSRDTALGIKFPAVTYYDGQGFMVPRSLGIDSALQLTGAKVCLETGSEGGGRRDRLFQAAGHGVRRAYR